MTTPRGCGLVSRFPVAGDATDGTARRGGAQGGDPELHLSLQDMHDLQQVFSRGQSEAHDGLTPGFLEGVQHQRLVQGRSPRHRGVLLGRVAGLSKRGVKVALRAPVKRGDGVVFEHGQVEVCPPPSPP